MKRLLVALAIAAAAPLASAGAQNVACTAGTDMTSFTGYVDCRGAYSGNINGNNTGETGPTGTLNNFGGQWAGNWQKVGKSDEGSGGWFAGGPVTLSDPDIINFDGFLTGKFVVGVKQATYFSYYLYNWQNQQLVNLDWRGVAPSQAGYSHIMLYTVNGTICERNCNTQVPEPASATLVVSGLAALFVAARRRRTNV